MRSSILLAILVGCASTPPKEEPPPPAPAKPAAGPGGARRAEQLLVEAKRLAQKNDVPRAIERAKAAIGASPRLEEAHLLLASLYSTNEQAAEAREALTQGLEALPSSAEMHHALGMLELELEHLAQAVTELEAADKLADKKSGEIAADLAYALIFAERLDDAEEAAQRARTLSPKDFAPAFTLGEVLLRKGRPDDAAIAYKAASDLQPDDQNARRRLAQAYAAAGRLEEAGAVYEALANGPMKDDALIHAALGQIYLKLKRLPEAARATEQAKALAPDDARIQELYEQTHPGKGKR